MNAVTESRKFSGPNETDFHVADLALADWGRKAVAIATRGTPVFAYKGESLDDYWSYTHKIFEWPAGRDGNIGPNMILDDGGDATLLVHLGAAAEADPACITHATSDEE